MYTQSKNCVTPPESKLESNETLVILNFGKYYNIGVNGWCVRFILHVRIFLHADF